MLKEIKDFEIKKVNNDTKTCSCVTFLCLPCSVIEKQS